ncbi:cyanate transporter [Aliiglaciecola sp. CAU 1673]|uniref:cyanate transporter n=1 Tax=Aliiglaciecola sp. CAU 1673 TaxID=3032595 RepID=UPI0023DC4730|nr:cyanate transporter [Aliiglaciecola sp. CAU 1673]MDF2178128.1 cyanate transporter [Aliiglaciecola sp. CAU 1673]
MLSSSASMRNAFSRSHLLLGVILLLIGLNLRPVLASVGPLLVAIQADLDMSFSQASFLTSLPVLAMGGACFFGFRLADYVGLNRVISAALVLLTAAIGLRFWVDSSAMLILTALLAGLGIALIQALIPALIKARFADKVSMMMGLYVTAIMAGATFAAYGSPLLAQSASWREGLGHWLWPALLALLLWLSWTKANPSDENNQNKGTRLRFWGNKRAWHLALLFGVGTGAYVCVLAWLAPYAMERGYSDQQAGLLLAYLTLMEVVAGLLFPYLVQHKSDRRPMMMLLCLLQVLGFAGLALAPELGLFLWATLMGLGIGGMFPLAMILTLDHQHDPIAAGRLTAFVQGIGYLLAGVAPYFAGVIRDNLQGFEAAWLLLASGAALMLLHSLRFNPKGYAEHFSAKATAH